MGDIGVGLTKNRSAVSDQLNVPEGALLSVFPRLARLRDKEAAQMQIFMSLGFGIGDGDITSNQQVLGTTANGYNSGSDLATVRTAIFLFSDDPLQKEWNKPYGDRFTSFRSLNSAYGLPIQQGSSSIRVSGNIIWMADIDERIQTKAIPFDDGTNQDNFLIPQELYYNEYHYFANFAIAFTDTLDDLEGNIVRLWADGEIIWDVRDVNTSEPAQLLNLRSRKYEEYDHYMDSIIQVYNGISDNTGPDSTMLNSLGTGNVPNYKGMCYAVFHNLDLNMFNLKIPTIQAEISYDATHKVMGKGMVFEGNYQTNALAWQHYTTDKYVLGSVQNYWQNLDVYTGIATQSELMWQYDENHALSEKAWDSGSSAPNTRVDKWGNVFSHQGAWGLFYYGNSTGHAIFHHRNAISAVLSRVFDDKFWFPPDHNNQTALQATIVNGADTFRGTWVDPGPLSFIYVKQALNPGYGLITQAHLTSPFKNPAANGTSTQHGAVYLKKSNVVFGTRESPFTNLSPLEFSITDKFGQGGLDTHCMVPEFMGLFMQAFRGTNTETQIFYLGISGFLDQMSGTGESTYPKWSPYINNVESALELSSTAQPAGCVFSDSGTKGKILSVSSVGLGISHEKYKFDAASLVGDDTLFKSPGVDVADLVEESDLAANRLQVSQFTYSQGVQMDKIVGIVNHDAGQVIDIGWGFYDVLKMSRVGNTYNHSEAEQIAGEAAMSPIVSNGGADYIPSIYGVLGHPFLGGGNPTFWLFRVSNNWQTLDVVISRLLLPFVSYITPEDIDVTDLSSIIVKGYVVYDVQTISEYIKRLQDVYLFSVVEIDSKLVFKRRGQGDPIIPITEGLLGSEFVYKTKGILDLSETANINYIDYDLDFLTVTQRAAMLNTQAIGKADVTTPTVFDKDEAAEKIDIILKVSHAESKSVQLELSREFSYLTPTDIISFKDFDRARITSLDVNTDGSVTLTAVNESLIAYNSDAIGETIADFKSTKLSTSTIEIIAIEVPYSTTHDNFVGEMYFASYQRFNSTSPAMFIYTDAVSYTNIGSIPPETFIGKVMWSSHEDMSEVTARLQPSRETQREGTFDYSLYLDVYRVFGDAPISRTEAEIFGGRNILAIGEELVGFLNVELISENRYRLTGLLRGMFSTYNKMDTHLAGEHVVEFYDLPKVQYTEAEISSTLNIFATSREVLSETAPVATNTGVSFTPLEVANIEFSKSVNDIVVTWDRKNRYDGRMLSGGDIPTGDSEYKVEIVDYRDNSIVRTFSSLVTETITYTSAQQVTDFGVNQDNVTIIVYQVNTAIGDGRPERVSSTFTDIEYIRDFSVESVGVAPNLIGFNNGFASANIVATRENVNVLEIDATNSDTPYYYILDDMYSVVNKEVELVFRYDVFSGGIGSILRIAFEGVDENVINYIQINSTKITYFWYNSQTDVTTREISIDTLEQNKWYKFTGSLINDVFRINELIEPQYRYTPSLLVNEQHSLAKSLDSSVVSTLGGGVGVGNQNKAVKTQIKYIKVL